MTYAAISAAIAEVSGAVPDIIEKFVLVVTESKGGRDVYLTRERFTHRSCYRLMVMMYLFSERHEG